jgi:quercetin dioxygenase-like cupin family protein
MSRTSTLEAADDAPARRYLLSRRRIRRAAAVLVFTVDAAPLLPTMRRFPRILAGGATQKDTLMKTLHKASLAVIGLALAGTATLIYAQASGLTRTLVLKADSSIEGREAVVARVEVAPGAKAGRHTHPGDEISYVIEGEALLLIDGQPPRTVKAGESFLIPAGVVHDAHNVSNAPIKLVGVYVGEKGKPLASPAPAQ